MKVTITIEDALHKKTLVAALSSASPKLLDIPRRRQSADKPVS